MWLKLFLTFASFDTRSSFATFTPFIIPVPSSVICQCAAKSRPLPPKPIVKKLS